MMSNLYRATLYYIYTLKLRNGIFPTWFAEMGIDIAWSLVAEFIPAIFNTSRYTWNTCQGSELWDRYGLGCWSKVTHMDMKGKQLRQIDSVNRVL